MNPEELAETSLHPDLRVLEPLVVTSVEEAITHMKIIMGNENDRREFVLGHIKEVFGIYLD
jgi:DNA gyrase/topoisomerase IV subunit B